MKYDFFQLIRKLKLKSYMVVAIGYILSLLLIIYVILRT